MPAAAKDTYSYFTFVTAQGADWDADVNSSDRYGAASKDALVNLDQTTTIKVFKVGVNASSAYSWKIAPGTYKIVADLKNMKLTVTKASGVDGIEADDSDAAPVYYNLQGVRVDTPSAGLYIVVRGNKVTKEVVR